MKRTRATLGIGLVIVPPRVEASLWRRLRFERELRCREEIFERYRDLARAISRRQHRMRAREGVEGADLEQFAYEGLLQAIDRFDPLRRVPFSSYARRRILGSVTDGAARLSEAHALYGFRRRLESERLRLLAEAPAKDGPLAALAELAGALAIGLMIESAASAREREPVDLRPDAYESLAWRETQALLIEAIDTLPEREATIIRQHYLHAISFVHIAALLGVTKGRVSQLHKAALTKLRRKLVALA